MTRFLVCFNKSLCVETSVQAVCSVKCKFCWLSCVFCCSCAFHHQWVLILIDVSKACVLAWHCCQYQGLKTSTVQQRRQWNENLVTEVLVVSWCIQLCQQKTWNAFVSEQLHAYTGWLLYWLFNWALWQQQYPWLWCWNCESYHFCFVHIPSLIYCLHLANINVITALLKYFVSVSGQVAMSTKLCCPVLSHNLKCRPTMPLSKRIHLGGTALHRWSPHPTFHQWLPYPTLKTADKPL